MPNARKKKAAKNEDFKKTKLKVGKKKAIPDNFTDTSFRSKSIVLPNQSINEDKSHEITTSRNLTLADLIVQLKHYNAGVRKEALAGMVDICSKHPPLLVSSLGLVVHGLLKLFVDDDREVRKATLHFLKETMTEIDPAELEPFMSLLIIYTCSAMTHIFEDVRLDAVKLMDLWIQIAPEMVVTKFWTRIMGNYMSLLTVDANSMHAQTATATTTTNATTAASIKAAATKSHLHIHKSKLGLFSSLSRFLEAGLSSDNQDPYWFLTNYLTNPYAKQSFNSTMQHYALPNTFTTLYSKPSMPVHPMVASVAPYLSKHTFSHLHLFGSSGPDTNTQTEFSQDERLKDVRQLIETFQPMLVASWLEAAPSVFMAGISMTPALELLYQILRLSLVLWRAMVSSGQQPPLADLNNLLKHLTVYFPYGSDGLGQRSTKVNDLLQEMNIMLCELTSLFLLAQMQVSEEGVAEMPSWASSVVQHVLALLGHEQQTSSSFSADHLTSLLPAIWGFLNCLAYEESLVVFRATLQYYHACQPNAASKKVLLNFITRVYMIQSTPSYQGQFRMTKESELARLLSEWLVSLPKTLWQLRANHIETSRMILNVLCAVAKRGDQDVFEKSTLKQVETALVPFFFVQLARGPLFGPFQDLPADVQQQDDQGH
ncbi:Rix1 complex component [Blakeslea trispora]|nr:Rix1 complex component [Blakeslea trispora]